MLRDTFTSPLLSSQSSSTGKVISLLEDSEALGVLQESARASFNLVDLENGDGAGGATINLDSGWLALGALASVFMGRQLASWSKPALTLGI